jgi:hypothetical protein
LVLSGCVYFRLFFIQDGTNLAQTVGNHRLSYSLPLHVLQRYAELARRLKFVQYKGVLSPVYYLSYLISCSGISVLTSDCFIKK